MSANRSFRADFAVFCAKRGDNLSRAMSRQALARHVEITPSQIGLQKIHMFVTLDYERRPATLET
jgi:hypothetical protein